MHEHEINRNYPTVLLFLLDQSGSMEGTLGGGREVQMSKAQAAADVLNRTLQEFIRRCSSGTEIKNYFDIGIIGYGRERDWVGPVFGDALQGADLVTIGEIANNPAEVENRKKLMQDGTGGLVEVPTNFPVWVKPVAGHNTPMVKTLEYAYGVLESWIANHKKNYPPTVINITDGESTDGDPTVAAQKLTSLSTEDGNVLLFNCHLSVKPVASIPFPADESNLPDEFARTLFGMSSAFPPSSHQYAEKQGWKLHQNARGFVFNGNFTDLVHFMNIGTRRGGNIKDR